MLGAICGDIVGSVYEGNPIKTKDFPLFTEEKEYTDDTVMTVAVANVLLSLSEYSEDAVKEAVITSMKAFGQKYNEIGYGGMFRRWLFLDYEGKKPYGSFGNGSAMRVSSVGWLFDSLEQTREVAKWTAEVTHNHEEGVKGAEATAAIIYLARTGHSKKEIQEYVRQEFYPLDKTLDEIRPDYKFDASCQGTVPPAIQAFLEGTSFEDVIRNAISLGGDSDTLTCIAGSMAEACYEIPEEIRLQIQSYLPDEFLNILDKFYSHPIVCSTLHNHTPVHANPKDGELSFKTEPAAEEKTVEIITKNLPLSEEKPKKQGFFIRLFRRSQ